MTRLVINKKNRYFLDTNTLISASLFKNSPPGHCLAHCVENGIILTSAACLAEIE